MIASAMAGEPYFSPESDVRNRLDFGNFQATQTLDGPLCGIYAVCTAARLHGVDCNTADYVTAHYVSSSQGSTPDEMIRVCKALGLDAEVRSPLNALDLYILDLPVIANVRSSASARNFDHWSTVVPKKGGVWFYDGPSAGTELTMAEFLGLWSGVGIVVSRPNSHVDAMLWLSRLALLPAGLLLGLTIARRFGARGRTKENVWPRELAEIGLFTLVAAAGGHWILADVPHLYAGARVALAPFETAEHRIETLEALEQASRDVGTLLVDARFARDYEAGAVQRAINIPVNTSLWEMRELLAGVDRATPVLVYCHSNQCGFDESIARSLQQLHFKDVRVCSEGWVEYRRRFHGTPSGIVTAPSEASP
jgi:rhodanese-related sulfurtransferase